MRILCRCDIVVAVVTLSLVVVGIMVLLPPFEIEWQASENRFHVFHACSTIEIVFSAAISLLFSVDFGVDFLE